MTITQKIKKLLWFNNIENLKDILSTFNKKIEVLEEKPSGGISEAPIDNSQYARQNGDWSKISNSQTPIDLSPYALTSEINFPNWTATSYSTGKKVSYLGKYWKSNTNVLATDIPGTSPNWIEDNSYSSIKTSLNIYNRNANTSGGYLNASGSVVNDANFVHSDFIEVNPSTVYTGNTSIRFRTFYDINKTAIVGDYGNVASNTFTTSSTARYVRLSLTIANSTILDLRKSSTSDGLISPTLYEKTIPYSELGVDSVLVNPKINLFNNTEALANNTYFIASSSVKGTESINYQGVILTKLTGNTFGAQLGTRFTTAALPTFIPGEKYFMSCYILNLGEQERFIWMRNLANTTSNAHEPKLIDGRVRRIWTVVEADSATTFKQLIDPTLTYSGNTSGQEMRWMFSGSNFKAPDTQALDIRIGGFQVERIDSNTYTNGVALIGDSTMAGSSGSKDLQASREVSTYASGLLNVPFFNRAVGGERTDQMDARWATDITPVAKNSKYVIIQGGINDINQGRALADIKSSFTSMYNKAIADGMIPILMTCTPSVLINVLPAKEADRIALNLWIKTTYPLVMDIAAIVADPLNISALNPKWIGDGTHFVDLAKRAIGNAVANWEFWDFKTPKPYQQVLSNWTPTLEKPFDRKIGKIKLLQGISIFSETNDVSLGGRNTLI